MSLTLLKNPNKEEFLEHIDSLIEKIKEYNSNARYKVSQAILSGEILTPSKRGSFLSLQFIDCQTKETFPRSLLLKHNLTTEEMQQYEQLESESIESKFKPIEELLISNYVKVQTLINLEINPPSDVNQAKIVFNDKPSKHPSLKYSLNIKPDFFNDKKLNGVMIKLREKFIDKTAKIKI